MKISRIIFLMFLLLISQISLIPAHAQTGEFPAIVFVARAHLATEDDIFVDELGPAGQFGTGLPKFAPGSKLMIRDADGSLTTLIDGSNPAPATGNLIDVQSPDVSFNGQKIIFAGATTTDSGSLEYGWRLYEINVDGTGFQKINVADRTFNQVPRMGVYDFGNTETYSWWNDLFPAYLADGRIVFASTRYPIRTHYDERHTYNLYIMEGDGSNLRRITTDRGGFLHPTPLPDGRILATRWWNNFNQPSHTGIYNRIDNQDTSHNLPDGTIIDANPDSPFNPATGKLPSGYTIREAPNAWHLMVLNPDGTDLQRYAFTPYGAYDDARTNDSGLDAYTAAQPALVFSNTETFVAFTSQQDGSMVHSTLKTGIRVARPGIEYLYANSADAIAGLTYEKAWDQDDESPPYALHPWGVENGNILFSYTLGPTDGLPATGTYIDPVTSASVALQGSNLQYALYTMNLDGSNKALIPMDIGTADAMDAKPIIARTGWSALPDEFTAATTDDPVYGNVPNTIPEFAYSLNGPNDIQTATVRNPNIYANAPLNMPYINNSPMPGTIATAQIYIDANQFTGAYCYGDYPDPCDTFQQDNELRAILWTEVPVSLDGEFEATVPADVPGFVMLRDSQGQAVSGWHRGYISIAQGNAWARPGETVTCTGCHFGHVSGSMEAELEQAKQGWTNIAPYASVQASSLYATDDQPAEYPFQPAHLNDRRGWVPVPSGGPDGQYGPYKDTHLGWMSAIDEAIGAWVELQWPVPMLVSKIRLVGPEPQGGDWEGFGEYDQPSPYHVTAGTLRFYNGDSDVGNPVPVAQVASLSEGGTLITLTTPRQIDRLTFTIDAIEGKWWYQDVAALNEIEVIGKATQSITVDVNQVYLPILAR